MSLFAELQRRNVIRVGVAYTVGAWLLIQVADIMTEAFTLPEWTLRLVIIVLLLGLPVVLFVAWAFELTPEGIKRESEVDRSQSIAPRTGRRLNNGIVLLLLLAVAYLLFDKFWAGETTAPNRAERVDATPADATTEADRPSIAVLPFDNRSRLDEDVFFVQGVHDDLLTSLARIGDLKVISRTTVMRYADSDKTLPQIAADLGVDHIMEGAVQRAGKTVRINVQLIEAASDEHLWAEIFDRELTADNLFAIQSEIAGKIAEALKSTLTPEEQRRISEQPTEDLAAYNAYLRGRQSLTLNNAVGADRALVEFRRAVDLDPGFALAWVGLANGAVQALRNSDLNLDEAQAIVKEAVEHAMAIDDQLGEAHLARYQLLRLFRDFSDNGEEHEAALLKAIELSPGSAEAWEAYSDFLGEFSGRGEEALHAARQAAELDPLSNSIQNQLVSAMMALGRYDEAERKLLDLIALDEGFAPYYALMANLKTSQAQYGEALAWKRRAQERDPGNIRLHLSDVWLLTTLGMEEAYEPLLEKIGTLDPNSSTEAFVAAIIAMRTQNYAAALENARAFQQALASSRPASAPLARVHGLRGEAAEALENWSRLMPEPISRDQWLAVVQQQTTQACEIAWALMHAQDPELGRQIARDLEAYVQKELPEHHQDQLLFIRAHCKALLEENEAALEFIETAIEKRQLQGYWWEVQHPALAVLRDEPRFYAAVQRIEAIMAEERARFRELEAQTP